MYKNVVQLYLMLQVIPTIFIQGHPFIIFLRFNLVNGFAKSFFCRFINGFVKPLFRYFETTNIANRI